MHHRAPLVVALLLLVVPPLLYVGSYLAVVKPFQGSSGARYFYYPIAGRNSVAQHWFRTFYHPLEWADSQLRPESWLPPRP